MFAPADMSEVDIFVFEDDVQVVAETVARLGVMHLLDVSSLGNWAEDVSKAWATRVATYTAQERRVLDLMRDLHIEERPTPCDRPLAPVTELVALEKEIDEIESRTQDLRQRERKLRQELEHWDLVARSLRPLVPLSIGLNDLRHLEYLHLVAGTIPAENLTRLEASLFRIPYTIIPVYRYNGRVLVFAFCAREHAPILDRALQSAFLSPLSLPEEFSGTPHEVLQQVLKRRAQVAEQLAKLEQERQALAEELAPQLLTMLTRIRLNRTMADAISHFGHRGQVYLIAGWVPKSQVPLLRAEVERAAQGRATFEENSPYMPGQAHKVPTLLRHSRLLQPIESIVSTYGTPGYREIDPTLIVGLTFVLMFGIMFGDLGHGLVLAAIGLALALGLVPKLAGQKGAGIILAACGLSSSIFGVLYGSLFGMEDVIPHLWLKPMQDIPTLLLASVVLGVIILNIGFACRLITAYRKGQLIEAIFDRNGVAGVLLYWSLIGSVLSVATGHGLPGILLLAILLLMTALFFSRPLTNLLRGQRPIFHGSMVELLVESFFELFETMISYVSNTLSYVRLGAFAVAHGGLSMAVFLLADLVSGGPSGALLRWVIIILGNVVVMVFEGVIVAIQTLRLEYYELFGKFYSGEGIPFKPLKLPIVECQTARATARALERSGA